MDTFLKNIPSAKAGTKQPVELEKQETRNLILQIPYDMEKHFAADIRDGKDIEAKNELQAMLASEIKHTTIEAPGENILIEIATKSQLKSPFNVQQGLSQLKIHEAQSLQTQGPSSTPISVVQTPLAQEMEKPAFLQGQILQPSTQVTNQMRQASLAYQTGAKQQAPSSLSHSIGQGLTGATVVGIEGVSRNGCNSTLIYPNPSNFPKPLGPRNMQGQPLLHPSPAGPYQQSVYTLNSQMQSFQFQGPPQSHQNYQNQSIYPSYQPIYVTRNFYGNVPGPMTQHSRYIQAPRGPQTNLCWSGAGPVGELLSYPLARDQEAPIIVQEGSVQQSSRLGQDLATSTFTSRKRQRRLKGLMEIVDTKTGKNISDQIDADLHNRANQLTQQNWSREMITEFVAHVTKSTSEDSGSDLAENDEQQFADNEAEEYQTSEAIDENCPTLNLYNKVRGMLNNLVPQKLDVLVVKVNALHINSEEKLQGVVRLVFQKAIGEPRFMGTYALMCKKLSKMRISSPNSEAGENESNVTFGKLIATRCKMALEKSIYKNTIAMETKEFEMRADPEKKELQETLTDEERGFRTKSFRIIRFIGELIVQKMLKPTIIHKCINYLLEQIDDESLECLCKLISTAGEKSEQKRENLDPYFEQIVDIVDREALAKISSRVRFMLLDLIELRKNKWIPRRSCDNNEAIDQIQIEAGTEYVDLPTETGPCSKLVRNQQQYVFDTSKPENKLKFEFTFGDNYSSSSNLSCQLSMAKIREEILSLMSNEKENSSDRICSWISVNIKERVSDPEFIKVLMTAILEVSIEPYNNTWKFRVEKFRNLQPLIPRYIDVNIKLSELQCLIAIQEYIHQLEYRQRLLLEILEKQIYQSILSFDVFHASERSPDATPLTRKSVAMLALKSFFKSLRKANDESRSHD